MRLIWAGVPATIDVVVLQIAFAGDDMSPARDLSWQAYSIASLVLMDFS
jgi:hypothetical protein